MDEIDPPPAVQLRDRLLRHGTHTLTDIELVSVLLPAGPNDTSPLALAEQLLRAVGGVPGLARSHPETLYQVPGLSENAAARLVAALALPLRRDPMDHVTVASPSDFVPLFRPLLSGLRHERLAIAVCDRGMRVQTVRTIADGATDGAPFPTRDLLATVLRHDGHAFAIAHNHPSGNPTPSAADRSATAHCRMAAQSVGLELLAHLVIGDHSTWASA